MEQLKAVVKALEEAFPKCRVYTEKVKAAGNLSCFYVRAVDCGLKKELNDVYRLKEQYEIAYYDREKSDKSCLAVNEKLDYYLKRVGGISGRKLKFEIKNGVSKTVFEYSCRVRLAEPEAKNKMSGIKIGMEMIFGG